MVESDPGVMSVCGECNLPGADMVKAMAPIVGTTPLCASDSGFPYMEPFACCVRGEGAPLLGEGAPLLGKGAPLLGKGAPLLGE